MEDLQAHNLQAYIEGMQEKYEMPALAVGISRAGQPDVVVACGVRKAGSYTPVAPGDKFYLGSCGKTVTAALIRKLVDEGRLGMNDRLEDLFPDLPVHDDFKNITVADLLTHRSGLPRDEGYITQPAERKAGQYHYSNVGYVVLGEIAHRVTGKAFHRAVQDEIFDPLEMTTAEFDQSGPRVPAIPDQPCGHEPKPRGESAGGRRALVDYSNGFSRDMRPVKPDYPEELFAAGAMMRVSPADWLKFLKSEWAQPRSNAAHVPIRVEEGVSYIDAALFKDSDGTFIHHGLSDGSFCTQRLMPREKATFCIFSTNTDMKAVHEIDRYLQEKIRHDAQKDFVNMTKRWGVPPAFPTRF